MAQVLLTEKGYKELEKRLEWLKSVGRAEAAERIKIARGFGDLSENAEYDAAKNDQAAMEGEIFEIEQSLHNAKIIRETLVKCCKIVNGKAGEEISYHLVGTNEVDVSKNFISEKSPVGNALANGEKGDVVSVTLPSGKIVEYKIIDKD